MSAIGFCNQQEKKAFATNSTSENIPLYSLINSKHGQASYGTYTYNDKMHGLNVEIPNGGSFVFNKILDTNKMDGTVPLIKIYPYATIQGVLDYTNLYIKLEDAYDENNYFMIHILNSDSNHYYCYERIALSGSGEVAYIWSKDSDNELVKKILKGKNGSEVRFAMDGTKQYFSATTTDESAYEKGYNAFYFDAKTKEVSVRTEMIHTRFGGYNQVICDLDDLDAFSNPWNGFSTNECKLSIYASSYNGSNTAKIFVTDILDEDLTINTFKDEVNPKINIDLKQYSTYSLPDGLVNHKYKVFEHRALDAQSGIKQTETKCYLNYGEANQKEINVQNGYFLPEQVGLYTIEYGAIDNFNNKLTKTLEVNVKDELTPIVFNIDESTISKKAYVGEKIKIAKATVNGGSGNPEVTTSVICNDSGVQYEIVDGYFTPSRPGTYAVKYLATDYLGRLALNGYFINVSIYNGAVIGEDIKLPKYLIEGFKYTLPNCVAKNYKDGTELEASIIVSDANGEKSISNYEYTPSINNSYEKVTIKYYTDNNIFKKYLIPCIKVNQQKKNYFNEYGCSVTDSANSIVFESNSSTFGAEFINSITADGFSIDFAVPNENCNYDKIDFYLTDSVDFNQQIKITFEKNNDDLDKTLMSVNNGYKYSNDFSFESDSYEFSYYRASKTISNNLKINISIDNYLNGHRFAGFTSGKIYVSFEINNSTIGNKIELLSINKTLLNSQLIESPQPFASISVTSEYGGCYQKNDYINIPLAVASLVFDPSITLKLSVTDNDGNDVTAIDGVKLKNIKQDKTYVIKADKYGAYNVSYVATDSFGKKSFFDYQIKILNYEKPVITVEEPLPESLSVGSSLTIPKATLSVEGTICYYYKTPEGDLYSTDARKTISLSMRGNYIIRFVGFDNNFNLIQLDYQIIVY